MESKYSYSSLIICCFLLFVVLHSIPECLAARKLLDIFPNGTVQMPPPAPVNKVAYRSETKNGSHGQIVYVNGQPRSQSGTIRDKSGNPVIQGNSHSGSQNARINGKNGPEIHATNNGGTIFGPDGKPMIEAHKYDNGTTTVTMPFAPPIIIP